MSKQEEGDVLVKTYLKEAAQAPLLTKKQEVALGKKKDRGIRAQERIDKAKEKRISLPAEQELKLTRLVAIGKIASDTFVKSNLRLVVSIAKRFAACWVPPMPLLDCIQEGNIGLLRAVKKFDWRMNCRFSTHATWWIRQAIQEALKKQARMVKTSDRVLERISQYKKIEGKLAMGADGKVSKESIAFEMGLIVEQLEDIPDAPIQTISLDTILFEDSGKTIEYFIEDQDDEGNDHSCLDQLIKEALRGLPKREQRILSLRFGLEDGQEYTLDIIGKKLKLTKERIRQLQVRALRFLRKNKKLGELK